MKIADYPPYDNMRYNRPWLAVLKLIDGKLKYEFLNDSFKGDNLKGGSLEADIPDGSFLAFGQKDYLGKNSTAWIGRIKGRTLIEMPPSLIKKHLEKEIEDGVEADKRKDSHGSGAPSVQPGKENS